MLLGGRAPFLVDAADFDGTNDYATRGAGLTNAADSKLMTFVMWQKSDTVSSGRVYLGCSTTLAGATDRFSVSLGVANKFYIIGKNSSGTTVLDFNTTTSASTTVWQCLMCSVDLLDNTKRFLYLGDTNELNSNTYVNTAMDFTVADWSVGAQADGSTKIDAGQAEMMLWTGVYIDFSVEANRRLFFSATGKPVDPNAAGGAIATLGAPDIYFHLNDGEAADNYVANNDGGDGGAFTVTGALTTYASSPSD